MSSADYEQAKAHLAKYVRDWIAGTTRVDADDLAEAVVAAPARNTLNCDEWWDVAVLLAQDRLASSGTEET